MNKVIKEIAVFAFMMAAISMIAFLFSELRATNHGQSQDDEIKILHHYQQVKSKVKEEKTDVIKDYETWALHELPTVDFDKEMVLAVYMGPRATAGYTVKIVRVVKGSDKIYVHFTETEPGKGPKAQVIISPCCFAVIPKSDLEVEFVKDESND